MSVPVLVVVWGPDVPRVAAFILPLLGTAGFYLVGQAALFAMMRLTSASRVAPLLGAKILVLSLVTAFCMGQPLSGPQWAAIAMCLCAVLLLNTTGGMVPVKAVAWLLVACSGYSLSDINIERLVTALQPVSLVRASVIGACLSSLVCGTAAALYMVLTRTPLRLEECRDALPFSVFWFIGTFFLFASFASIGPLFGNLLQSTRGIMSIVMGAGLARLGCLAVEQRVTRTTFLLRIAGAMLMCAAILLFHWARGG
jgi:drug/metabolite transporter (DMT)-like permease